jgi:hypothetical protein
MHFVTGLGLISCAKASEDDSNVNQLTAKSFACKQYSQDERMKHLAPMPTPMVNKSSFRVGNVDDLMNQLTGIPTSVLDSLFRRAARGQFFIAERSLATSVMGETKLINFGRGFEPTNIYIAARPDAIQFALQHEVGHAVESVVKLNKENSTRSWQSAFQEGVRNSKLRSYARSNQREYFAEAFANFYCSPESHEFVKTELPVTYKELVRLLPKPDWQAGEGDFYLLVEQNSSGQSFVYVSAPMSMSEVNLSYDATGAEIGLEALSPADTQIKNRLIFRSKEPVAVLDDVDLLVSGQDNAGGAAGTRKVTISKRT